MIRFAGLAALLAGCSLTLDFADECDADGDCEGGLVCVDRLCVKASGGTPDGLDQGPGGSDQGVGAVTNASCPTVYGVPAAEARAENVVLIGSLLPSTGQLGEFGPPMERSIFLAIDEINQSGGINGKKLAVLACDDASTDVEKALASARHLIDVVGVQAIVGAAASSLTIEVFKQVAEPKRVVMVSPASTTPAITDLPDRGLLWRTAPSDAIQGAAIAAHITRSGFGKVAVVNRDDTYGNGLQDAIRRGLCAADQCGEDVYLPKSYAPDNFADGQSRALVDLQDFDADIIVLIGFLDDGINFLNQASAAGLTRFILTDGMKDTRVIDDVGDRTLVDEVLGTAPAEPQGDNFRAFTFRYRSKWDAEPGVFTSQTYDATYVLAYALAALDGRAVVDGPGIAGQLKRLSAGRTKINVGGTDFNRGVQTLRRNAEATIDVEGASGTLDFDPNKGEAAGNIEAWRFDLDGHRVSTLGIMYTAGGEYHAPETATPGPPDAGMGDN